MTATNTDQRLLFLDFDGVLCDSVLEGFVSSWIAYYRRYLGEEPGQVALSYRQRFYDLRPYLRNGEDFLVIHHIVAHHIPIASQSDFDSIIEEFGQDTMQEFRRLVYQVRSELVEHEREYWVKLNRIFPEVRDAIAEASGCARAYILSTKKAPFIAEILAGEGFSFPLERIITAGARRKLDIIDEILIREGATGAHFIDDQPDHLDPEYSDAIACHLARWGYVLPEWLEASKVPVVGTEELARLTAEVCSLR